MVEFKWGATYNVTAGQLGLGGSKSISSGLALVTQKLVVLVGMLAVVFIIVGAIQMVTSNGDPKRFAVGRQTVTYAVVGMIVAIAAFAVVSYIAGHIK